MATDHKKHHTREDFFAFDREIELVEKLRFDKKTRHLAEGFRTNDACLNFLIIIRDKITKAYVTLGTAKTVAAGIRLKEDYFKSRAL